MAGSTHFAHRFRDAWQVLRGTKVARPSSRGEYFLGADAVDGGDANAQVWVLGGDDEATQPRPTTLNVRAEGWLSQNQLETVLLSPYSGDDFTLPFIDDARAAAAQTYAEAMRDLWRKGGGSFDDEKAAALHARWAPDILCPQDLQGEKGETRSALLRAGMCKAVEDQHRLILERVEEAFDRHSSVSFERNESNRLTWPERPDPRKEFQHLVHTKPGSKPPVLVRDVMKALGYSKAECERPDKEALMLVDVLLGQDGLLRYADMTKQIKQTMDGTNVFGPLNDMHQRINGAADQIARADLGRNGPRIIPYPYEYIYTYFEAAANSLALVINCLADPYVHVGKQTLPANYLREFPRVAANNIRETYKHINMAKLLMETFYLRGASLEVLDTWNELFDNVNSEICGLKAKYDPLPVVTHNNDNPHAINFQTKARLAVLSSEAFAKDSVPDRLLKTLAECEKLAADPKRERGLKEAGRFIG